MRAKIAFLVLLGTLGLFVAFWVASTSAAPLPDNCTKDQGTVTCTDTSGPGNNPGVVGETTTTQGQGTPSNTSPEPQDLQSGCTQNPPKAQGGPIACP
jgi:hypothetical protein